MDEQIEPKRKRGHPPWTDEQKAALVRVMQMWEEEQEAQDE